ncbi:MAG: phosphonate ABC transporter, permease protein PhnE [Acetobacteraceae bacterium]|nr:phosphonate ABC transporter, permease protein PhnE [Acetobacteraceae bacterium]
MTTLRTELLAQPGLTLPKRRVSFGTVATIVAASLAYLSAFPLLDISPDRFWRGLSQLGTIARLMLPPETGGHLALYLDALVQTLSIALLGTLLASIVALPLGFLAARNVVANRVVHLLTRRSMDAFRSIDALIWALIWVNVVGLGPFAGLLAIATSDVCALAKLMSEAVEAADRRPVEATRAVGGSRLLELRFGLLPQILPIFASQLLYFFESNTRSATIIGIVGAGGIGLHLYEQIRVLEWQQASFLILLVLVTVALIDAISQRLRAGLIGRSR